MTFLKRLLLLCCLGWLTAWADAGDLITQRAWVEDPSGRMTLDQVLQAPQQNLASPHFNQGFSASTFWVRLRIDPSRVPPAQAGQRLVMRIWPPYLDELQLFDPLQPGSPSQVTGDRHPMSLQDHRSLNLSFVLPAGQAPRDVWVRLQTITSTLMDIEVLTEFEAKQRDWQKTIAVALYLVVLVACLGWASMAWVMLRDRLILYYMARELAAIGFSIVKFGVLRAVGLQGLSPAWIDGITSFMVIFVVAPVVWFDIQFLSMYRPSALALRTLRLLVALSATGAVLTLLGWAPLVLPINSWLVTLVSVVVVLAALSTRAWSDASTGERPDFPRWLMLGSYMVMPVSIPLNRAAHLDWLPPWVQMTHAPFVYLMFGSITMMLMLQLRALRLYRRQTEVQLRLRLAEQLAQEERARREEQERFLAMLGHELRNPLAAVGMLADPSTEDGQQIRRAVADMTQVLERSVQSKRLDAGRFRPEIAELDLQALLQEVCGRSERIALVNLAPGTRLWSDRLCLQMALGNLVDNALKYSPPGSVVQVRCTPAGGDPAEAPALCIQVANLPGPAGRPDPQQLFQKYYRSPLAHHQIGSGLGLYLTHSLLQWVGASVRLLPPEGAPPAPVVFELSLPLRAPAATAQPANAP